MKVKIYIHHYFSNTRTLILRVEDMNELRKVLNYMSNNETVEQIGYEVLEND